MPRGIPNPKPAPAPVASQDPAPMIFIEPAFDGSIRINGYGLSAAQIVDSLRRVLIHLVANQSGIETITLDVPPRATILVHPANRKTTPHNKREIVPAFARDVLDDD